MSENRCKSHPAFPDGVSSGGDRSSQYQPEAISPRAISSYNATNPRPSQHKPTQRLCTQASAEPDLPPRSASMSFAGPPVLIETSTSRTTSEIPLRRALCEEEVK